MKERFINFLEANNVYEEFCKNVVKDCCGEKEKTESEKSAIIEEYLCNVRADEYISSAFPWYLTPEGNTYWMHLDADWQEYRSSFV